MKKKYRTLNRTTTRKKKAILLAPSDEQVTVVFEEKAMCKMLSLIFTCNQEVGWHGIGKKIEHGKYIIDDIFLYPQKTTSTTITAIDYAKWQSDLVINGEEEKLVNLCFHGHSHVDMKTYPSGVDRDFQDDTIKMIQENRFYIFLIINKSMDFYCRIADKEDNSEYLNVSIDTVSGAFSDMNKEYTEYVTCQYVNKL